MQIITLTTDFGYSDPFSGLIKGVIYKICPGAKIVDLTHNIPPQDIWSANFILSASYNYFPKGTIHLCIVDPGVGSLRKPLLIETRNCFFIGPDNGLFTSIIENEKIVRIVELTEKKYWLKTISQTFHGRDIFSPVAAYLAKGIPSKSFGKAIKKENLVRLPVNSLIKNKNSYTGIVQYIDHFGNLITNIPHHNVPKKIRGKIKNFNFQGLVSSYSEVKTTSANKLFVIRGSSGYLELFVNKGNAAKVTGSKMKDKVKISF